MDGLGKLLLIGGGLLVLAGLVLILAGKTGLGRIPGDIVFHRGSFTLYVPLTTMILVSLALSLILALVIRLFRG